MLEPRGELFVGLDDDGFDSPDMFWTGERLGVAVYQQTGDGIGFVGASHADRELAEASSLRTLGESPGGAHSVAWNGEGYGLCWNGYSEGTTAMMFQEVAGLDGPLGPSVRIGESRHCKDLVFGHGRYAVTWISRHPEEGTITAFGAQVAVLARDGTRIGEPIYLGSMPISSADATGSSLEVTETGFAALANDEDSIHLVLFSPDGVVTRDQRIAMAGIGYTSFAFAGDRLGLATLNDTQALTFRIMDADLEEVVHRVIVDGAPMASNPRLLARPEGWLLVWGEGYHPSYRIMMLSLDPDGVPLAPRRVIHDEVYSSFDEPSLLSVGDDVYISISHDLDDAPEDSRAHTLVQRWSCERPEEDLCRPQDAEVRDSGDCIRSILWGWKFDGSACVPVYDCDSGCRGADCDRLSVSRFACESDRRECLAPPRCDPAESLVNQVCAPRTVVSDRVDWLTVHFGGTDPCPCERPTCELVPTGPFELTARLFYCADEVPECDCLDPAPRPSVQCAVPPLGSGRWTLRFRGREPLTLHSGDSPVPRVECR